MHKSTLFILSLIYNAFLNASTNDTLKLFKIKYYYTSHMLSYTGPSSGERNLSKFIESGNGDSIVDKQILFRVDSILKSSKKYCHIISDTQYQANFLNSTTPVNRVIALTFNVGTVYISDAGNWDYDRRFFTWLWVKNKKTYIPHKRKIANKYVWINGSKIKNDKQIKMAIDIVEKSLKCDWCLSMTLEKMN